MKSITFISMESIIGPSNGIFWIQNTTAGKNLFIGKHESFYFATINILPDPLATNFSCWLLTLLQTVNTNFFIAFFKQIKIEYPLDRLTITSEVFGHHSKTFSRNVGVKSFFHKRNALFCTASFWSARLPFNIN